MKPSWLLLDELRHLVRTRAVVIVLFCLPLVLAVGALQPGDRLTNLFLFTVAMGSNLAGLVCGATVTASCIADLQQGTPVLFAVRPIPRGQLLLARFLAAVILLAGTMALSLTLAAVLLKMLNPSFPALIALTSKGLTLTFANALLQGALGVLLGVSMSNMLAAVILYLLLGMNLGNGIAFFVMEGFGGAPESAWLRQGLALGGAFLLTALLLWLAARIFSRKSL